MTGPTKRDLKSDLETLRDAVDEGAGVNVFIGRYSDTVEKRYCVTTEPGEEDPIDSYTEPVIPIHLPPAYRGGVTVFDDETLRAVWDEMPEEVRARERAYRREHDEPIPSVLAEE
jgi:hypothetical protein